MCDRLHSGYPLALFFRAPEVPLPYDEWDRAFSRLDGIAGKALDDEIPGRETNIPIFTQFKREHPEQLVMLHISGNARSPYFPLETGFAGYFLHRVGSVVTSAVPAQSGQTTLSVAIPAKFQTDIGLYCNRNDDISLCAYRNGRPDWSTCEQTRLVSINRSARTMVVERAQYGTQARAFPAGQAYAASHVTIGPWREGGPLLWLYNYSTAAPTDAEGRRGWQAFADDLSAHFVPSGDLGRFDGIIFDNIQFKRMKADYDGDGVLDDGVVDGVNTYGLGIVRFSQRLRQALPDKLMISDGMLEVNQRSFGLFNGMESEGFPSLYDLPLNDWSGGINRHNYWLATGAQPTFSTIVHKFENTFVACTGVPAAPKVPWSTTRMVIAASLLTDATFTYALQPEMEPGESVIGIWDELVRGTDQQKGWLGRAVAKPRILAVNRPDILEDGPGIGAALAARFVASPSTRLTYASGGLSVAATDPAAPNAVVTLRGVPVTGSDVLVMLKANSAAFPGMPKTVARLLRVSIAPSAGAGGSVPDQTIMTWLGPPTTSSQFYFRGVRSPRVDVRLQFEGAQTATIREIAAYAHPAVMVREFEHGVVLANPSDGSYTFNLATLFAGKIYRRILASSRQDRATNDGTAVGRTLTLPRRDAIVLVRTK